MRSMQRGVRAVVEEISRAEPSDAALPHAMNKLARDVARTSCRWKVTEK
jgi:hypothetical protein